MGLGRGLPSRVNGQASLTLTLLFLTGRARSTAEAEGGARTIECRWVDTLTTEPGRTDEPLAALTTIRGYLFTVGESTLAARNVSKLYHTADPEPAALVHSEPLAAPPDAYWPNGGAVGEEGALAATGAAGGGATGSRPLRVLLTSGSTLLVESGGGEGGAVSTLRLYTSTLPYDPPVPPTWPKYVMGAAVIGITVVWQLYKRGSKGKGGDRDRKGGRGGKGGGGRGGRYDFGDGDDYDDGRGGGGDRYGRAAAAHMDAHMRGYGGKGGGFGSGGGSGGGGGGWPGSRGGSGGGGGRYGGGSDRYGGGARNCGPREPGGMSFGGNDSDDD